MNQRSVLLCNFKLAKSSKIYGQPFYIPINQSLEPGLLLRVWDIYEVKGTLRAFLWSSQTVVVLCSRGLNTGDASRVQWEVVESVA